MLRFLRFVFIPALIVLASASVSAQTVKSSTPTTRILAIGTIPPNTDIQLVQRLLPQEVRETVQLYLAGKIDQWYSLQDRTGVVFVLNSSDLVASREMLEGLPLGLAHLMSFELIPIGPLNPLRQLK